MFGCIVAGRLVQTNLQQVDVNKFTFQLDDAENINHIVVFLLGTIPFQPGYAATVHLLWPNKTWQLLGMLSNDKASAIFRLKSAATASRSPFASSSGDDMTMDNTATQPAPITATLGISMEPIDVVMSQIANLPSASTSNGAGSASSSLSLSGPSSALVPLSQVSGMSGSSATPDSVAAIAKAVMAHLYNHVTSFATAILPPGATALVPTGGPGSAMGVLASGGAGPSSGAETSYLPVKAFNDWYQNVLRKVKADPMFLSRE